MPAMALLNDFQRAKLKAQHRFERDKRICDRIKAVLLRDKGWSHSQIAEALLISENTVGNHVREYQELDKLKPEGGGSDEKLSKKQSRELERLLQEHTYLYVKDIISLVKAKWGISYSASGMRSWLNRHNFTYKKPCLVPGKADANRQEEWIREYQQLKANLPSDETICFIDGVHPTHNVQLAYGWIKKGTTKEIPSNSGRSRINLSGSVDILSHNVVVQEDKTLNADATIQFFKKLEQAYPDKKQLHVFCDNARYYRNKAVTEYLKESKITLHFLPPYSPNLNPIERLWKWMKEKVVYNSYYEEFEDFRGAVMGFFKLLSGLDPGSYFGQQLRSRVKDQFRPISAPS